MAPSSQELGPSAIPERFSSAEGIVAFYNQRGTCEQYIKEGKNAIKWTRLSCRTFAANAVRLQLHSLDNLGNFMRTLAIPETAEPWSLTSLREKLIKIGAKVVSHGRYVTFQMAEVAVPRQMFADILSLIARCGHRPRQHERGQARSLTPEVRPDDGKAPNFSPARPSISPPSLSAGRRRPNFIAARLAETEMRTQPTWNPGDVG